MTAAPVVMRKAQVEIPEGEAGRERVDVHARRRQQHGLAVEVGQRVLSLVELGRAPLGPAQRLGVGDILVAREQRGVEDAVA